MSQFERKVSTLPHHVYTGLYLIDHLHSLPGLYLTKISLIVVIVENQESCDVIVRHTRVQCMIVYYRM